MPRTKSDKNSPMDPTSPTAIRLSSNYHKRFLGPPKGSRWAWQTEELLASRVLSMMPHAARQVLDRVILENVEHRMLENGRLKVTYSDFEKHGVRRQSIKSAIDSLRLSGLIRVEPGTFSSADRRRPNRFTITWFPVDGYPPTNDWRRVAVQHLAEQLKLLRREKRRRRTLKEKYSDAA